MSSVQKYKFHRGDFFVEDKKVGERLDKDLKKYAGQQLSIEEVCQLSENILSEIKKDFKANLDFTFTVYKGGNLYLEFFIAGNKKIQKGKTITIPQEIIDAWNKYHQIRMAHFYKETNKNGYWHTKNPQMAKMEDNFQKIVTKNFETISNAVFSGETAQMRQISAYLLNWYDNKKAAMKILLKALRDPEHIVHNEAARAIIGISKKVKIPKKDIFNLLSHPNTSCRGKALAIVLALVKEGKIKIDNNELKKISVLAKSYQPNNYKLAKLILRKLKKL